jgi:hypothetical protein
MARKKYQLDEVLQALSKKKDLQINATEKVIYVLNYKARNRTNDIGNKSLGKLDYLTKVHRFSVLWVSGFPSKPKPNNNYNVRHIRVIKKTPTTKTTS